MMAKDGKLPLVGGPENPAEWRAAAAKPAQRVPGFVLNGSETKRNQVIRPTRQKSTVVPPQTQQVDPVQGTLHRACTAEQRATG